MSLKDARGSMLLESVLVLPIFILIVFFIIQITFVWTAKQMTYYAAYCGARAALVYNPADYCAEQQEDGSWQSGGFISRGVVHQAACAVLSWISWSIAGFDASYGRGWVWISDNWIDDFMNFRIGLYTVPLSSNIRNQVAVEIKEYEKIKREDDTDKSSDKEEPPSIHEQFPAVKVTVAFKCPLFIPLGGPVVAYFFGARDQKRIDVYKQAGHKAPITHDSVGVGGFTAYNGDLVHQNLVAHGNYTETEEHSFYSIVLQESCTMAKPYKTDTFPLMPQTDKTFMGMIE